MRNSYPTDLSDREWEIIQHMFQTDPKKGGRPAKHPKKEIVNAIFYVLRAGCAWRLLPHDFPPWQTVYQHFRDWQNLEVWEQMNSELTKKRRVETGRREYPTAAIIDSQFVKTTEKGGSKDMTEQRKSREGKGTFWWIPKEIYLEYWSLVNAANERDGMNLLKLLREGKEISSQLQIIYGDTAYNRKEVRSILEEKGDIRLHIVSTPRQRIWVHKDRVAEALEFLRSQPSFQIQPRRWVASAYFCLGI